MGATTISDQLWGTHAGKDVRLFSLRNSSGAAVELSNYGATLVSIYVPDRNGELGNVVLGYPDLEGYLEDNAYLGSTIGRFANRISGAAFSLDGHRYELEANDGINSNHSGKSGFHNKVFDAEITEDQLTFSLYSPDGSGGFPGNLSLKVNYRWTENNQLMIGYTAATDKKTVLNLTNHAYFNLSARPAKVSGHELRIGAGEVLEAGADHIPTGKLIPAAEFSFVGNRVREGLNKCYVLKPAGEAAAVLSDPRSGRVMTVFTSYPGLMLYTADFLKSKRPGHYGERYGPFDGLCLECQFYPDSPNQAAFPSTVLEPGELYEQHITYQFNTAIESI